MDDDVGAVGRSAESFLISDVADKKSEAEVVGILLLELVLLEFVAGKNPNGTGEVFFCQEEIDKGPAERAGSAGEKNGGFQNVLFVRHSK